MAEHVQRGIRNVELVDWFNNRRLLEPIGYTPPAEYEEAYSAGQEGAASVA